MAAAACGSGMTSATGTESGGVLYHTNSNGQYSFVLPDAGTRGIYSYDPTSIPDGTTYAGFYHTHPNPRDGSHINEQFSGVAIMNWGMRLENLAYPNYLGTAQGRILMFDPQQFGTLPTGCVLVGSPVASLSIPRCP